MSSKREKTDLDREIMMIPVYVDDRGRVLLPKRLRKTAGLVEGQVLQARLIVNKESKQFFIVLGGKMQIEP